MRRLVGLCGRGEGRGERSLGLAMLWAGLVAIGLGTPMAAEGRQAGLPRASPVYMDDSPRAVDGLIRALELAAVGNHDEAARVLQSLLFEEGERVLASRADADLFTSVRSRVHQAILSDVKLLERYRAAESALADRLLAAGEVAEVERSYLLTSAGFEAALRIAQGHIEEAHFDAGRLTLLQLEKHPDRKGARGTDAAKMLSLATAHSGAGRSARERGQLDAMTAPDVERWRREAGLGAVGPEPLEEPALTQARTLVDAAGGLEVSQLLPRPLWSDTLGEVLPITPQSGPGVDANRGMTPPPEGARWLYMAPTVWGDLVLVNNSETISAWNRFTLSLAWRVRLQPPLQPTIGLGNQRSIEEQATVQVGDGIAVSVTGLRIGGDILTDRRIVAIDARSGTPLWTRRVEDFSEVGITDAAVRGGVVIDQGVVIFSVEKDVSRRRLDSHYLVGLDLHTGALRWSRALGSSGTLNFGWKPVMNDAPMVFGGVVFLSSKIGFIAAVECATGRPVWLRRTEVLGLGQSRADLPWQTNVPVTDGQRIYTISPSRSEVLSLDMRNGAMLGRRGSSEFNSPDYLLIVDDMLLTVSPTTVDAVPLEDFSTGATRRVLALSGTMVRGRVCVIGSLLLVPTHTEALAYDPRENLGQPVSRVALDRPGVSLPLEGQLIVVDDVQVHTYLVWTVADRMLRERMDAAPDDPEPAVTYAELSYRAGRVEGVAAALDRALAAIERDPLGATTKAAQSRIFKSVLGMVEPGPEAPVVKPLDAVVRGELIDRLGLCASTVEERVAFLLAAGQHAESIDRPGEAVRSYQRVLDAPELTAANYVSAGTTVSGEFEATRRMRRVIRLHGRGLYDAYQADADRMMANLLVGDPAARRSASAFETIARRFPLSRAAVRAWMEAGAIHAAQQQPQLAALAFEEGLAVARETMAGDDASMGELAGRLVQNLARADLVYPAVETLERLLAESPGLVLTENGETIDAVALAATLKAKLARGDARPQIGAQATGSAQMVGWVIEPPDSGETPAGALNYVMMRAENGTLGLFKTDGPGVLKQVWGELRNHVYLWMDATGVYFSIETGEGATVDVSFAKVSLETGKELWRTPVFRSVQARNSVDDLVERPGTPAPPAIETPLKPRAPVTEVMYTHDDRTLVALDRVGRGAGFDLATGRLLWTRGELMARTHGAALRSGVLVVGGSDAPVDLRNGLRDPGTLATAGVAVAMDVRSGQTIDRMTLAGRVRWIRMTPEGSALVGMDRSIVAIDVFRGSVRWRAESRLVHDSLAAWALPGRLIVRKDDGRLWQVRTSDGAVMSQPLETRDLLDARFRAVSISPVGELAGLATERGLALFDREGKLVGMDFRETTGAILTGGWGDAYVPTLELAGDTDLTGMSAHHLNVYEVGSLRGISRARISIGAAADSRSMTLLHGKALLSTGAVTTVIDMPLVAPSE